MTDPVHDQEPPRPLTDDEVAARKRRNRMLAAGLLVFVILVGVVASIRIAQEGIGPGESFYGTWTSS